MSGAWLGLALALALAPAVVTAPAVAIPPLPEAEEVAPEAEVAPEGEAAPTLASEGAPEAEVEPAPAQPLEPPRVVEPRRITARDRRPTTPSRTPWYTSERPPLVRPTFRVAPGFSGRVVGPHPAAFAFDVLASVMVGLHPGYRQLGLAPELGYSLRTPRLEHRLLAGVGVVHGINAESWTVGWLPRVVAQLGDQTRGLGMRNGLWLNFAENGFSVELSHQWLRVGGADQHELQLTLGIDLAMLAFVLSGARVAWL